MWCLSRSAEHLGTDGLRPAVPSGANGADGQQRQVYPSAQEPLLGAGQQARRPVRWPGADDLGPNRRPGDEGPFGFLLYAGGPTARRLAQAGRKPNATGPWQAGSQTTLSAWDGNSQGTRYIDSLTDPWARGTYSFPAPGQVMTVSPILNKGLHNRLHFAGEHCCLSLRRLDEDSTLNSAVRLARRLAEQMDW